MDQDTGGFTGGDGRPGVLPAFEATDFVGNSVSDRALREMAPVLVVLLRGFG